MDCVFKDTEYVLISNRVWLNNWRNCIVLFTDSKWVEHLCRWNNYRACNYLKKGNVYILHAAFKVYQSLLISL